MRNKPANYPLMNTEVWAQLHLSLNDCSRLHEFLVMGFGIRRKYILRSMHITVYYARRPLPSLYPLTEPTMIIIPAAETRFMVMAPGGENSRPDIDPSKNMIGIRIHRRNPAYEKIMLLRQRLLKYETRRVLGLRKPSTNKTNAFGARWFQPHMVMLRPSHGILENLTQLGQQFREKFGNLVFDKFEIKIVHRKSMRGFYKTVENT